MKALSAEDIGRIAQIRAVAPEQIAQLAAERQLPESLVGSTGRMLLIAADHSARGALRAGADPLAMGDRAGLLDRLVRALRRPGVDGVLATADVIEDLLMLGALHGKIVVGSMNRSGLAGTAFEIDDRFTGFDAESIARNGYQGGKMLFRIDPTDVATPVTMQACAEAVMALAEQHLMALVEPFIAGRDASGRLRNDLSTESVVRSATVAAGLSSTSAYTWLKLPVVDDMDAVLAATTLPVVLLGGEVSTDQGSQFEMWSNALAGPTVRGMVVGRSLLYPPDDAVEAAVDATVEMMTS